ncbi:MAG: hypothetical protein FWF96_08080 [Kiritimatiellaeota bacterium]|nr:hypothetical protein [Kiritimatiellota bacterium]
MTPARKKPRRTHRVFLDETPARVFSLDPTGRRRGALNHIFDGGMRIETRLTREFLLARRRRVRVWRALAALAFAWLLFQFINP